jgi:phage/plasmid-like protein (TIGR03299 family)
MTASLFGSRYFGRKAAWHNMGVVMDRPLTASEAVAVARLDYTVETTQAYFKIDGDEVPIPNTVSVYRTPTADDPCIRPFGVASKGFTIVQNTDLARILDPMTREWPVETAGALKMGEVVWFLLDMGEGVIAGEQHRRFAWARNSHTPGLGLLFKPVRTRVVCANTDAVALNEKGVAISLRHTADVASRFEEVVKAMEQLKAQNALDEQALEALAEYTASSEEIEKVMDAAYPLPKAPTRRTLNGVLTEGQARMREQLERKYELDLARMTKYRTEWQEERETLAIQFPRIGSTAYGWYQALISSEQYRRDSAANAASAFFGQGYEIQRTAKKQLLALVG